MFTIRVTPGGEPDTLEKALAMLPPDGPAAIQLTAGEWFEAVRITRPHTTIAGPSPDHPSQAQLLWDDPSVPVLSIGAEDVSLSGLTVQNTLTSGNGTACAVISGDLKATHCAFLGSEEVLCISGHAAFSGCQISGTAHLLSVSGICRAESCTFTSLTENRFLLSLSGHAPEALLRYCRFYAHDLPDRSVSIADLSSSGGSLILLQNGIDRPYRGEFRFAANSCCSVKHSGNWGPGAQWPEAENLIRLSEAEIREIVSL